MPTLLRNEHFHFRPTEKYSVLCVSGEGFVVPAAGGADNRTKGEAVNRSKSGSPRRTVCLDVVCEYCSALAHEAFRKRRGRWRIVKSSGEADLHWGDYECLAWDRIVEGGLRANSYCIRKGLSRKAQLSMYVRKHLAKGRLRISGDQKGSEISSGKGTTAPPSSSDLLAAAMPKTLVIDTWEAFDDNITFNMGGDVASFGDDFGVTQAFSEKDRLDWCLEETKEAMAGAQGPWILKPSTLNKGVGVSVVDTFEKLRGIVHENPDIREWVLQDYITNPLLLRGRKFHLRAYVLAVGCLRVLFFDKVLLLSAARPYTEGDWTDAFAHLTNTARQAEGDGFKEEECVGMLQDLIPDLQQHRGWSLDQAAQAVAGVSLAMRSITAELFRAFRGEFAVFSPLPHCFELFGLDFMVGQDDFQVYLLEVNPGPDMKQTGDRLKGVIEQLTEDTVTVCCDRHYNDDEEGGGGGGGEGGAEGGRERPSLTGTGFVEVLNEQWMGGSGDVRMKMI